MESKDFQKQIKFKLELSQSSVGYHTKAIANSTGKWLEKLNLLNRLQEVFTIKLSKGIQMPQIAWAHSKSIWRGTSKWFSNAYKSAKGWLTDMANKSRSKWDNNSQYSMVECKIRLERNIEMV